MMREPAVNKKALANILGLTESAINEATEQGAPGGPRGYQVGAFFAWLLLNSGVEHHAKAA
ncbi:hypothetical protein IVB30_00175 [Bradyrhizobium sp. 200]|uniref:hypothetical protein n=1 Tax=Bradyrhizobium sp. 200 TaxID=2782665 RepID=UPI001FFE935E|nr:hypothetical protein [Bradyrhizobium sp. 200]UPJ49894.1 hypothetical protein IVB30_00175 [Bradyrhizobium sp. 200]